MYRMQQREMILALVEATLTAAARCCSIWPDAHREDVFAAHTHTQPAQPTTIAHYLLAVIEQLERDGVRLPAPRTPAPTCNPLGACAITGHRAFRSTAARTTELLGFDAATGNTYGSIATVDYLLESVSAAAVLLAGLGRVVQDLLLWCTSEFGYLRLADGFVQCSSIMPQKRNPVALEHARAIGSKALGQASAILLRSTTRPSATSSTPRTTCSRWCSRCSRTRSGRCGLVAAAMATAEFDRGRLAERAGEGWITVTELADTLAREHGVPFKTSHDDRDAARGRMHAPARRTARRACCAKCPPRCSARPIELRRRPRSTRCSARSHFVAVRTTPGGPAPSRDRARDRRLSRSRCGNRTSAGSARRAREASRPPTTAEARS